LLENPSQSHLSFSGLHRERLSSPAPLVLLSAHTPAGGTFTFDELSEDLQSAGFTDAALLNPDEFMNAVIQARKA